MIAPTACGCKRAKEPESVCGWSSAALSARNRPHWPETHRHGIVSENHNTAQLPPIDRRPALRNGSPALARSFRFRIPQPPAPRGRRDRACRGSLSPYWANESWSFFFLRVLVFVAMSDAFINNNGRHSPMCNCTSWMRPLARPEIHSPDRGYGFPGSLVSLAPRNDDLHQRSEV